MRQYCNQCDSCALLSFCCISQGAAFPVSYGFDNGSVALISFRRSTVIPSRFLGSQGIELFCSRQILPVGRDHLTFLDHVHEFNALQGDAS